jgi:signal transduction histidine kinase
MLDNALRNAAGEVEITTRLAGSSVEIHVLDDGAGLELELAIIRTIAELHGGRADAAIAKAAEATCGSACRPPST